MTASTPTTAHSDDARREMARGERFSFGKNWQRYVEQLDERRIAAAEASLAERIGATTLRQCAMLDIGSGSGLFSLAAHRMGADVTSFDFDPDSVAATQRVRQTFADQPATWRVLQGSVLDPEFMRALGTFDLVYSWGVLHHTGRMWAALDAAAAAVSPGGQLFIAIYNDQGWQSRAWHAVKRLYCAAPGVLRPLVFAAAMVRLWGPTFVKDLLRGRPFATWRAYEEAGIRGMSPLRDAVDWIGGYPFEVASRDAIVLHLERAGFSLETITSAGTGLACNEFVLRRSKGA